MTDEKRTVSDLTSLSWPSQGSDPLDDIKWTIEKDKRDTVAMLGCSADALPRLYQTGFDTLDWLVSGIVTGKKAQP